MQLVPAVGAKPKAGPRSEQSSLRSTHNATMTTNGESSYTPTASTSSISLGPSTDDLKRELARRAEDDDGDIDVDPMEDAEAAAVEAQAHDLENRRQSQLRKQSRFTKASVIIPPENFAIVEDSLYRSVRFLDNRLCLFYNCVSDNMLQSQPTELNFPFLQRLNLKTLIWLAPEELNQPL